MTTTVLYSAKAQDLGVGTMRWSCGIGTCATRHPESYLARFQDAVVVGMFDHHVELPGVVVEPSDRELVDLADYMGEQLPAA